VKRRPSGSGVVPEAATKLSQAGAPGSDADQVWASGRDEVIGVLTMAAIMPFTAE